MARSCPDSSSIASEGALVPSGRPPTPATLRSMAGSSRARAWLELVRPPNLPTIASNAVLGAWLGTMAQGRVPYLPGASWASDASDPRLEVADLGLFARVVVGICGLYVFGLILNDVFDLAVDRRERPDRPLPSGRIRVGSAVLVAVLVWMGSLWLLGGSGSGPAFIDPAVLTLTATLTALIVAYDLLHTRVSWAVGLPALCRGLAIVLAAAATMPNAESGPTAAWIPREGLDLAVVLVPAGVVAVFVFAVSVVARGEVAVVRRACPACGQELLEDAARCPECGRAVSMPASRIRTASELGRGPWWVVASGVPCLLPALGFGALLPTLGLGVSVEEQGLRDAATVAAFGGWVFVVAKWSGRTPVPRLVGRWLGSLCLIDAVMLAPLGPLPLAICVLLYGAGWMLARRFAGS
jgi:4-hydroxybenzoate polyprenyltransferase